MEQDDNVVRLAFDGREHVEHDLVIGADGINSTVAELMDIDPSPPVYSGANIYYGVIENPDDIDFVDEAVGRDHDVVQGNGTGEFITFRSGAPDKKVQVWANTYSSDKAPPREEWGVGDLLSPNLKTMLDMFPSRHPIHELATYTTPGRLLHFGLFYRKHKDVWSKGRTVLLGDSCHATLPYVGQGANQAIEDAVVLAECLSSSPENHQDAFQSYYEQRSRRTKRIVKMASYMDKMHHAQNPLAILFRDFVFRNVASSGMMLKAIEKEIVEECPVKDYAKYK
jgi:salicylate hydroxylase